MSHSKIGQYTKSQLYSLTDGVYRLERNFYLRVRGNGKYRTYFFAMLIKKEIKKIAISEALEK